MSKLKNDRFLQKCKLKHNNFYGYDKVSYVKSLFKIIITCPIHGDFEQRASNHLHGRGCRECANITRATLNTSDRQEFITKAKVVHGDKYSYDNVNYVSSITKVTVSCPKHGDFSQIPSNHLAGAGCPKCANTHTANLLSLSLDEFIEKAKKTHGDKYSYDKVVYVNGGTKVAITCPKHGDYSQLAWSHIAGAGCTRCKGEKISIAKKLTFEDFLQRARKTHGDKYNYDNVTYMGNNIKVAISCPKHGDFEQTPSSHFLGNGCPRCSESKGESFIASVLDKFSIEYIREYKLPETPHYNFEYDFYLPNRHLLIEFHGVQHYRAIEFFGGEQALEQTRERDKTKRYLARRLGYKILYINYMQFKKLTSLEFEERLMSIVRRAPIVT